MGGSNLNPSTPSVEALVAAAAALGAADVPGVSEAETLLLKTHAGASVPACARRALAKAIRAGGDPLGDTFCRLHDARQRRALGATYTPEPIIAAMLRWSETSDPGRVVDPGAGSGRFSVAAGRLFPRAKIVAVEVDPLAALLARANLATAGLADRATVLVGDYREQSFGAADGRTLFVGNPPYVRHHQIDPHWKQWLTTTARSWGAQASQLAGLHVHFFLATLSHATAGDRGVFITSSEWLDTNYGGLVRRLLLDGLGGKAIHTIEPTALPFEDATTTGVITCFEVGSSAKSFRLRQVKSAEKLGALDGGKLVSRQRLAETRRWSPLVRASQKVPDGYIELGEICRVHRGAVTGSNAMWVRARQEVDLPEEVLFPSITRARELFAAGDALRGHDALRVVVDLPPDLDRLSATGRPKVERFLERAQREGVAEGYIARTRPRWWSVGLRAPAPILATYMARRPPAFVRNLADARHINIAHGLYPRQEMTTATLDGLSACLSQSVSVAQGRTYAGGLTKFEPKEMERLLIPGPELLAAS